MRILVTGGNGFTARYVLPLLASHGHEVLPLAVDLTVREEVHRRVSSLMPDAVLHLAGLSYVPHGNDGRVYEINAVGAVNLLDVLSRLPRPPKRVVLASSSHVYGMQRGKMSEISPVMPVTHYGASKLAMEHLAKQYASWFEIVIARPFNYTGIGQAEHFLIPKLVHAFRNHLPELRLGNTAIARDFSDVRHIAQAYLSLLTLTRVPALINLCSGSAISLEAVIAKLEAETGFRPQIMIDSALVRAQDVTSQWGDSSQLEILTGASVPSFEDTLSWMVQQGR